MGEGGPSCPSCPSCLGEGSVHPVLPVLPVFCGLPVWGRGPSILSILSFPSFLSGGGVGPSCPSCPSCLGEGSVLPVLPSCPSCLGGGAHPSCPSCTTCVGEVIFRKIDCHSRAFSHFHLPTSTFNVKNVWCHTCNKLFTGFKMGATPKRTLPWSIHPVLPSGGRGPSILSILSFLCGEGSFFGKSTVIHIHGLLHIFTCPLLHLM